MAWRLPSGRLEPDPERGGTPRPQPRPLSPAGDAGPTPIREATPRIGGAWGASDPHRPARQAHASAHERGPVLGKGRSPPANDGPGACCSRAMSSERPLPWAQACGALACGGSAGAPRGLRASCAVHVSPRRARPIVYFTPYASSASSAPRIPVMLRKCWTCRLSVSALLGVSKGGGHPEPEDFRCYASWESGLRQSGESLSERKRQEG